MWLKDLEQEFINAVKSSRSIDRKNWAEENVDRLNPQSLRVLTINGLASSLAKKVRAIRMEISSLESAQTELPFSLPFAVSINPNDTRVKATSELTQDDMDVAIALRTKNVRDAQLKLSEFIYAKRVAQPFWSIHPEWTFGQCIAAYMNPSNDNTKPVSEAA